MRLTGPPVQRKLLSDAPVRNGRLLFSSRRSHRKMGILVPAPHSSLPDLLRTEPKGWAAILVSQKTAPTELPKLLNLNLRREADSKGGKQAADAIWITVRRRSTGTNRTRDFSWSSHPSTEDLWSKGIRELGLASTGLKRFQFHPKPVRPKV